MKPITVPYGGTIVEEWIELANSWNIIKMKPIAIRCGGMGWNTPDCTSREILNYPKYQSLRRHQSIISGGVQHSVHGRHLLLRETVEVWRMGDDGGTLKKAARMLSKAEDRLGPPHY